MLAVNPSKGIQSILWVCIKQPISKLIFSVCLDFEPRAVRAYTRKITGVLTEIDKVMIRSIFQILNYKIYIVYNGGTQFHTMKSFDK